MTATPALLRVMMVVPQYPYPVVGGLERQAHELAKALLETGIDVQVLSGVVELGKRGKENVEGVLVHRLSWPRMKALRFLRTPLELLWTLHSRRGTYDVVHLHQHSWFGLYTILCAKALGKPILTKLPNVDPEGVLALLSEPLGRLKLSILLRSDALVSMSEPSLCELRIAGFPPARTLPTPNGIRLEAARGQVRPKSADRRVCRVVFVGRLAEGKLLDTLLNAWREAVRASSIPAVLEFWGAGPLVDQLQRFSHELGISDSVIIRGHVDGVRERLPEMDIFALPSRNEGNSNAVLEAMAAGLPIVSTRVGGTPMQVGPEGADFLVQPGDVHALAEKLGELIRNPDLRARLGAAMRERVERYFDIRDIARTYVNAYRHLAAGRRDLISEVGNPVVSSG